jgi:hypothetical protein
MARETSAAGYGGSFVTLDGLRQMNRSLEWAYGSTSLLMALQKGLRDLNDGGRPCRAGCQR